MHKSSKLRCSTNAKQQMLDKGFCYVPGQEFVLTKDQVDDFCKIKGQFDVMSPDPYGHGANRFRQLRRYTLLSYAELLVPRPTEASTYEQSVTLNHEAGGFVRRFEPIPDSLASNPFLLNLIAYDFENSLFSMRSMNAPIDVGVHLIRMSAEPEKPGISTPDCLHKDGEPFTWIHLVSRIGVVGGENVVADNDKRPLIETTLEEPMDTIGVVDECVYHQVKRINVKEGVDNGYRDVILVDFTPMIADPIRILA